MPEASEGEAALEGRHAGRPLGEGDVTVGADLSVCPLPVEQAASPLRDTDEQKLPAEDNPPARRKSSRSKRAKTVQNEAVLKVLRESMETDR